MKKTVKRFYVLMAVVLSILLSFGTAAAAASHPFKDVISRYDEAVGYFYKEKVINGKSADEFGTYDNLKRGDAAVILSRALGLDAENAPDAGFKDVNSRIKGHVNALVKEGVINGFSDTVFSPDTYLTRGQMAAILVRAFNLEKYAKTTPFTDLSITFKDEIEALYGAGITGGISATKYGTNELIKRGDFVLLLYKTIKLAAQSNVKSVNAFDPIHVAMGANLAEINLPQEADVEFEDGATGTRKVQWDTEELDTNIAKEYVLQGTVEGTALKASIKVVVHNPVIQQPNDIVVMKGTSLANANLPKQVKLTYYGDMSVYRNITWNTTNLNLNEAGTYMLDGDIERLARKTTIKVIVSGVDVDKLEDIYVIKGTDLKDVKLPGTVKLNYSDGSYEHKNITWNTSNLDLNKTGEYVLKGSIDDTSWTTTVKVIVTDHVFPSKVELDKTSVTLLKGTSVKLTATVSPSNVTNKNVTWSTSDSSVAIVDGNGKVTAVAKGYAVIIATTANGKTDTATITVVEDTIPYLEVSAKAGTIKGNRIKDIELKIKNDSANTLSLEKIEVYDNNKLDKTYTKSDIQTEGFSPVIAPNSSWTIKLGWNFGLNTKNSYVKMYIKYNNQTFVYTRNL